MTVTIGGREPFTSPATCERKEWFRSEATAWHEVLKLRRDRDYPASLQPYQCNQCGRWHIGNLPGHSSPAKRT